MPRGGYRPNAGGRSTWNLGKTTTIRVPVVLAEQLRQLARRIDNGLEASSIDADTESKVLDLSGVSVFQLQNRPYVFVHDLIIAGYKVKPVKLANKAKAELGGFFEDKVDTTRPLAIQPKRE